MPAETTAVSALTDVAEAYAQQRAEFLRASRPEVFEKMQLEGTLAEHCRLIGVEAARMRDQIVQAELTKTAAMGGDFADIARLNQQIPLTADEVVLADVVRS